MVENLLGLLDLFILFMVVVPLLALFINSLPKILKSLFNGLYRIVLKTKGRSIRRTNPSGYYRNI